MKQEQEWTYFSSLKDFNIKVKKGHIQGTFDKKMIDPQGSIYTVDFFDNKGNIYEYKSLENFTGERKQLVLLCTKHNLIPADKNLDKVKTYRRIRTNNLLDGRKLLLLKHENNMKLFEKFFKKYDLHKGNFINKNHSNLDSRLIKNINHFFHYSDEKNKLPNKETFIKAFISTAFNKAPDNFINNDHMNMFSQLFFDKILNIESIVFFNKVDKETLENSNKFYKEIVQDVDDYYIALIFDHRLSSESPTHFVTPHSGKESYIYKNKWEFLNKSQHMHINNFYDSFINLIADNKGIDFSTKSQRLKFLRKYICNLSQNQFSSELNPLGITATHATIARWENDFREDPLWYRKNDYSYLPSIVDVLVRSDNIFGVLGPDLSWRIEEIDEIVEDFIIHDDYKNYRNPPHVYFQALEKYQHQKQDEDNKIDQKFNKIYSMVNAKNVPIERSELKSLEVQQIIKYLLTIPEELLFSKMASMSFSKNEQRKIYGFWNTLNNKEKFI
tara:strand:- start:115 stop:1614 length:1500 start_codon:yes stop_codon:yes gene_type:complete